MKEKFKLIIENDKFFYGVLVILMSIISFGLGRSSAFNQQTTTYTEEGKSRIQVIEPITLTTSVVSTQETTPNTTTSKPPIQNSISNEIVASKNGTKYHLRTCSGAKNIKPENIISFPSRQAAEAAGYTKAANCPGL